MALKPLKVKITGDTTQLENALGRAGRNLKGFAVAGAAAGALVTGALAAMTSQGLKSVDSLTKLARSMGATATGLRSVQIAAGYAGVSVGEVNASLQSMNRELATAYEKGTPAEKALRKIGLRAKDLADLDADKRLSLIADRIKELGLSSGESADLLRDLGVRGRNMSLLLMSGSAAIAAAREEVDKFGISLTETQTNAIESANDAIERMSLVFEGLRNKLAAEVAPILQTLADRFNELASSDAVQTAIERLVAAFGSLAEIILSEDFIGAAVSGLEMIANTAAGAAELMVTFSQNIELVTIAFGGLAIAAAALGGPLTLIGGALAIALVGIAKWRGHTKPAAGETQSYADAVVSAQKATDALNTALGTFVSASPRARGEVVALANENYKLAQSALAAAEAELAKADAFAEGARVNRAPGPVQRNAEMTADAVRRRDTENIEAARARLDEARDALNRTARRVMQEGVAYTPGETIVPTLPPAADDGEDDEDKPVVPGVGGAGQVKDELAARLEALQEGLATEREVLAEWYEEGKATLDDALANKLITEQEYLEARTRLEEEFAEKSKRIEKMRGDSNFKQVADGLNDILGAAATGNQKILKVQKVFASGMAWIDTLQGAARELRKGTFGFATAAAVIAKGVGLVAAIKGVSDSGYGGGGASAGAAGGASEPPRPTQNVQIDLVGASAAQVDQYQQFADVLNEAARQGLLTNITVAA